jgi:hypothetical protein
MISFVDAKVVAQSAPFHRTTELGINPLPLTVRANAGPPAVAEAGLRLVVAGTGLLIVKFRAFEMPPPGAGLKTVTFAVPPTARSAELIDAVISFEDT